MPGLRVADFRVAYDVNGRIVEIAHEPSVIEIERLNGAGLDFIRLYKESSFEYKIDHYEMVQIESPEKDQSYQDENEYTITEDGFEFFGRDTKTASRREMTKLIRYYNANDILDGSPHLSIDGRNLFLEFGHGHRKLVAVRN